MFIQIIDNKKQDNGFLKLLYNYEDADPDTMSFAQSVRIGDEIGVDHKGLHYSTILKRKHYDIEYGGLSLCVDVVSSSVPGAVPNDMGDFFGGNK